MPGDWTVIMIFRAPRRIETCFHIRSALKAISAADYEALCHACELCRCPVQRGSPPRRQCRCGRATGRGAAPLAGRLVPTAVPPLDTGHQRGWQGQRGADRGHAAAEVVAVAASATPALPQCFAVVVRCDKGQCGPQRCPATLMPLHKPYKCPRSTAVRFRCK